MLILSFKKGFTRILGVACAMLMLAFSSCSDGNVGEYRLTGNIEHLIPSTAYDLEKHSATAPDGEKYIVFSANVSKNFEIWGLSVKKVDYYIDGNLVETVTSSPFDIMLKSSTLGVGQHSLSANMLVVGDYCDDVILKITDDFVVSEIETTSEYADFYIDHNWVEDGGVLYVNPILNEQRSSPGTKIEQVEYSWDGKVAEIKTEAPFAWNTQIVKADTEPHKWSLYIKYTTASNKVGYYYFSCSNFTTIKENGCLTDFSLMSSRNSYELGETIKSVVKSFKGRNSNNEVSVNLYFDDEPIGSSSTFPYYNDFKLTNQKIGKHVVMCEMTNTEGDKTSISYATRTIVIIPSSKKFRVLRLFVLSTCVKYVNILPFRIKCH